MGVGPVERLEVPLEERLAAHAAGPPRRQAASRRRVGSPAPSIASARSTKKSRRSSSVRMSVRAVPLPDPVVQAEHRARQQARVALGQDALLHRAREERRPRELDVARARARGLARLLLARRPPRRGQQALLGDEDAVAQHLVLGQVERVGEHRAQRRRARRGSASTTSSNRVRKPVIASSMITNRQCCLDSK